MADDPITVSQTITYVGMGLGAAAAAFVVRMGWKKGGASTAPKDLLISGSAEFTDMGPIKALVENIGHLIVEQATTNHILAELAKDVRTFIAETRTERDIEEEVQRRVDAVTSRDRSTRARYARASKPPSVD